MCRQLSTTLSFFFAGVNFSNFSRGRATLRDGGVPCSGAGRSEVDGSRCRVRRRAARGPLFSEHGTCLAFGANMAHVRQSRAYGSGGCHSPLLDVRGAYRVTDVDSGVRVNSAHLAAAIALALQEVR